MKTICSNENLQNYAAHEQTCENLGMKLARVDSPEFQTALISFNNVKYGTKVAGVMFVTGVFGAGWCGAITNKYTGVLTDYRNYRNPCAELHFGYCEIQQPRGE